MKFNGPLVNQRWRIGPRLGSGSQARTYLAVDEKAKDERIVVLKQLELERRGGSWKGFELFEREVSVLKSLRHPGIPRYLDSFESEPGVFNLVMEKMPGATLRAIATKVRFTDEELRDILARLLEILDYIHRHQPPVIHRDIKPANLVRDSKGTISLVDFGGVRNALRDSGGSTIVGTFGYMAPEQLHGQATPATDLYALGATIVALAGGVEPEDVPRKGLRMDIEKHLAGHDPALVAVLAAMTAPDPDERPQSAREVTTLLRTRARRAALAISPAPDVAVPPGSGPPRPFDEVGDMLDHMPPPFGWLLRVFLLALAVSGYVAVALLQSLFLPLVFALVGAIAGDRSRPTIASTRTEIMDALQQGKEGFRNLQQRSLPGRGRRKQLARGKHQGRGDDEADSDHGGNGR